MTAYLIALTVIVAALAAVAGLLLARRRGLHRSDGWTSPPTQVDRLLEEHRRDVPLRGPDPREEQ